MRELDEGLGFPEVMSRAPLRRFRRELLTRDEASTLPPFLPSCQNCSPDLE
jgi:hypothetical protein